MKKNILTTIFMTIFIVSAICSQASCAHQSLLVLKPSEVKMIEFEGNPIIKYNDALKGMLWNDPSVIKEGSKYRMWLTGGKPFDVPIVVKTYEASSYDGIKWDINPTPVLEPGKKGEWDDLRIETPSVIKVGDTYHLYYSGCPSPCSVYDIGHATSKDGTVWEKDIMNPVIKHHNDPLKWGFYTVAEPAVVYHEGIYYLYYASAKSNYPEYGAPFGILLATSKDGRHFEEKGAVHTLTASYDPKLFRGYSTPAVFVDDGTFHLYHDVVYSPNNPDGFDQIAISSAKSANGFSFREQDANIITVERGWKHVSVLGPTVLEDNGIIKMWFSAQTDEPEFGFGIGYATKEMRPSK